MISKEIKEFGEEMRLFHSAINHRLYYSLGCHLKTENGKKGVEFKVWAPNAKDVKVVGTFNKWDGSKHRMFYNGYHGVWSIFIPEIKEGDIYKYEITSKDGKTFLKSDPFAFYSELRPGTASIVKDIFKPFNWEDKEWLDKREKWNPFEGPMNIYEVHLGSWKRKLESEIVKIDKPDLEKSQEELKAESGFLDYKEICDKLLPYVLEMGYTHVEIMPLSEHPLDASWGYQAIGYYSLTSRYGDPEGFKYFVNEFHKAGIGVILDWVPGHFCKDSHGLYKFDGTPLYEYPDEYRAENKGWGTANFNLGSPEVRSFLISNAVFLFDIYHIDGIRADAVSNIIYLEYGHPEVRGLKNKYGGTEDLESIEFLRLLNGTIFTEFKNPLMIAEEATAWPLVTRPPYVGGLGFNYKWNMGWMNDMLKYMEMDPIYRQYHHNLVTFSLMYCFSENYILSISHDEVVHGKKSVLDKMFGKYEDKFASLRMFLGYMYGHPGKKLNFMGTEIGQFMEWRFYEELEWKMLKYPMHDSIKTYVKDLNHLYKREKALWEQDTTYDGFKWIDHSNYQESIISFVRKSKDEKDFLLFVCNFTPVPHFDYLVGSEVLVDYEEIFNSDRDIYAGTNILNGNDIKVMEKNINGIPYAIKLNIPPLSTIILKPKFREKELLKKIDKEKLRKKDINLNK
ncbi:1,4-alpha-glucan branching protein GlgB [Fusobacterium sp. FSA-380-WT-3A]|uniref:1,4-alpha-glucan branching protein GlgB n=1 Tax=Fusobacterium sp. FSA-380-WT-3A TaxID=2725304 RepID=UPI0014768927|nr:1,4-alpha-glucan branching protein GlgB [Fusobacterium sp. FSA-380-WT-3A]NME35085.1 1,4-alpha-glucan branching protein GlgB [Fusobacterium sp. FSA-380-WT-3A]